MSGAQLVEQIVSIMVSGLTSFGTGIGAGVNNFVTALAISGTGEQATMSVFLTFIIVFCAVSLGIGITRHVFLWLESLSARG